MPLTLTNDEWKKLVAGSQEIIDSHMCVDAIPDGEWLAAKDFTCRCGATMRAVSKEALAAVWARHLVMEAISATRHNTMMKCAKWFRDRHNNKNNFDGYVNFMLSDLAPKSRRVARGKRRLT